MTNDVPKNHNEFRYYINALIRQTKKLCLVGYNKLLHLISYLLWGSFRQGNKTLTVFDYTYMGEGGGEQEGKRLQAMFSKHCAILTS